MLNWKRCIIIFIVALILGVFIGKNQHKEQKPDTITITTSTIDTIYEIKYDTIPFTPITKEQKPSTPTIINMPIVDDTTKVNPVKTRLYEGMKEFEKLKAELKYQIYADSIYGMSFQLKVNEETIIKESTTTIEKILPPKSKFFWGGGINYADNGIQSTELGLMYNRKQKWMAGIVINQQLNNNLSYNSPTSIGARIYMPL